jgi:hypothetical protein
MKNLPKTKLGKLSVWLIAAFLILLVIIQILNFFREGYPNILDYYVPAIILAMFFAALPVWQPDRSVF